MASSTTADDGFTEKERNVLVTARRKHLCDRYALWLVEALLSPCVPADWLLEQLTFLTQSHYVDVTEERALIGWCGYPLCCQRLGDLARQQHRYTISTRTNRVYDVTERRRFCSSRCFRASNHLQAQVLTSPLWLREPDTVAQFHLLNSENNNRGLVGDVVKFAVARDSDDLDEGKRKDRHEVATAGPTTEQLVELIADQYDNLEVEISNLSYNPILEELNRGSSNSNKQSSSRATKRTSVLVSSANIEKHSRNTNPGSKLYVVLESESGECMDVVVSNPIDGPEAKQPESLTPQRISACNSAAVNCNINSSTVRDAGKLVLETKPAPPKCRGSSAEQVVIGRLKDWLPSPRQPSAPAVVDGKTEADGAALKPEDTGSCLDVDRARMTADNSSMGRFLRGDRVAVKEPECVDADRPCERMPVVDGLNANRQRRTVFVQQLERSLSAKLPGLGLTSSRLSGKLRQLTSQLRLTAENVTLPPRLQAVTALCLLRLLVRRGDNSWTSLTPQQLQALDSAIGAQLVPYSISTQRLDAVIDSLHVTQL